MYNTYPTVNITDLRYKAGQLQKMIGNGKFVVLTKSGRSTMALISYSDLEDYMNYIEQKRKMQKIQKNSLLKNLVRDLNKEPNSKKVDTWLADKNITSSPDSWEYADKVLENLESDK